MAVRRVFGVAFSLGAVHLSMIHVIAMEVNHVNAMAKTTVSSEMST
jgi:hypothetical protein